MNWAARKQLFVYPWQGKNPYDTFAPLAMQPYSLFFDSARNGHPSNNYSYLCWHPFETIECKDGCVTITNRENQFSYRADPFIVVRERLALWGENRRSDKTLPPFQGGAAGFFGYELARILENIPSKAARHDMPDMCIGIYDKVIAFDHAAGEAFLMIHANDEKEALIHRAYIESLTVPTNAPFPIPLDWSVERSDEQFTQDIARAIRYIHAGDIFQTNLSRRFSADIPQNFDPYAHYGHLRDINAAPFGAYMNFGSLIMASASPERFLSVSGKTIETRPIKGTMPSAKPASDLTNSEKDRAENVMIVDLMRNDLSKVCEDHSIDVTELCGIETFEGLHHMISTVRGILRADQTSPDALRACFPGGSVTGAPKIRAMEIIDELEPHRRGPYCGAVGWIGYNGDMDTSITIRTIVYENGKAHIQTGAGIITDSDPKSEVAETLTKANKLFESFGVNIMAERA